MNEGDETIKGRGPIAMKREKVLTYGDPDSVEGVIKLTKTGPGEWTGRVWDVEMPDARRIKLTKEGVSLTQKSESWELETLYDAKGRPKTIVVSSQFFEKPVKIDIDEEKKRLDSLLPSLERGLGITRKDIQRGDADVSTNFKDTHIEIDNDEATIETRTEKSKPQGRDGRRYDIAVHRRYENFSLDTISIMCGAFREGNMGVNVAEEAVNMPKFLNLPEVKKEAERLRSLQR